MASSVALTFDNPKTRFFKFVGFLWDWPNSLRIQRNSLKRLLPTFGLARTWAMSIRGI
jgi:hypothetical protein